MAGLAFGALVAFIWIVLMQFIASVMVWLSLVGVIALFSYGEKSSVTNSVVYCDNHSKECSALEFLLLLFLCIYDLLFVTGLYFCVVRYMDLKEQPGSSASLIDIGFTFNLDVYLHLRDTWLAVSIVIGVILLILVLVFLFLRDRILIAIELIREGSK